MDALLTAFLSSGMAGNQNSLSHHGVSDYVTGSYKYTQKRGDEEIRFLNEYGVNVYPLEEELMSDIKLLKFRENVKQQNSCNAKSVVTERFIAPIISLEIDGSSTINMYPEKPEKRMTFSSYLDHQMHHTLVQKRISPAYFVPPKCFFTLGIQFEKKSNVYSHCCVDVPAPALSCKCDKMNTPFDVVCDRHELYFHGYYERSNTCAWIVNVTEASADNNNIKKNYIGNPVYDLSIKNLDTLADSFEVEFSNLDDCDLMDFECEITNECFDELNMLCDDFGNEDDMESLVYETSDDDDDDFCFQHDVVQFEISSSPYSLHNTDSLHQTDSYSHKKKSKYHAHCCSQPDGKEKNTSDVTKRVHFGEETVCNLVTWSYAYKQSRKGDWVKMANDRAHFKRRIETIGKVLEPVLKLMCDKGRD